MCPPASATEGGLSTKLASADRGSVTSITRGLAMCCGAGNRVTVKAAATASTRTEARESWLGRFLDYQELIGFHGVQHLMDAGRPANLDVSG